MTPPRERQLSTSVVASRFGVKVRTVRAWIRRGKLRAERTPGGHLRVPESALDAYDAKKNGSK